MNEPRFDVFLSHNSRDKPAVERLAVKLKSAGLEPWLDKWCLTPGGRWQEELIAGLRSCSACAVFVGPHGLGDWVHEELGVALDRAVKDRSFRLFLALLPGVAEPFDSTTLPPFLSTRTWVDLRPGIEDPRAFQHLANAIRGVPFGQQVPAEPNTDVCPYRGLQTFDEEHAEFFFGRDNDVQRLVEKLKGSHFLAVLGPSGSGKSSLVRAGLVPALRRGALPGSHDWTVCVFTPGAHPLTALVAQVTRLFEDASMHRTLDEMDADTRTLHLSAALALSDRPAAERVVLVIDQFEEIFTLCADDHERAQFLANLLYAASVPDGRCVVLLTLRADFYPKCSSFPDLSVRISAQQFLVSPLDLDGLRRAIEEPAWRAGLEFEQGLVNTILGDVDRQPGALPLLEHALLELWERRLGHMLTLDGYTQSGGVQGAIAKRADTIYNSFSSEEQAVARRALLRLTQPGEGTEDTRRRAALGELVTRGQSGASVDTVIQAMVEARLLTTSEDEPTHQHMVEVSHEALIRGWPQLRSWIEEDRSGLRVQRRLTEAALEWERADRDDGILYRGARLATAQEWRAQHEDSLNDLERGFLNASLLLREREEAIERERQRRELEAARRLAASERRRARVARLFSLGLAAVLVGALFATIVAIQQRSDATSAQQRATRAQLLAEQQRNQAQIAQQAARKAQLLAEQQRNQAQAARNVALSRELAANSLAQLNVDPQLSLLLASAAERTATTSEATDALRIAIGQPYPREVLRGHTAAVGQAVYSQDGRYVATASADKTARLFDARTGAALAVLRGHTGGVNSVAFNPAGTELATASDDDTARLWGVPSGRLIAVLRGHTDAVVSAAFSPDGRTVVTASSDDTARVWDAGSGRLLHVLSGHTDQLWTAVFSPNGRYIATASDDTTARLWDAGTGRLVRVLNGHTDNVDDVAFSADGTYLVTASWDKTARVWAVPSGKPISVIRGAVNNVNSAVFSPDGRDVLTASQDGAARVSDARTGNLIAYLSSGGTTELLSAVYSHDSGYIITAGVDGVARIFSANGGFALAYLRGPAGSVGSAVFSPDDSSVLTANDDGNARIWDVGAGRLLVHAPAGVVIWATASSPDGREIVTAASDGMARVVDVRSGRIVTVLEGQHAALYSAAFSPDGKMLATSSAGGSTWIWNTATWRRAHALVVPNGAYRVTFSPDGRHVAVIRGNGIVSVWDTRGWRQVAVLRADGGQTANGPFVVYAQAYSPDGVYLALAANCDQNLDYVVQIWSTRSWRMVKTLPSGSWFVEDVAFSPDGKFLTSASADSRIRVWDAHTWRSLYTLLGHSSAVWSAAFSPDSQWLVSASADDTLRVWSVDRWRNDAVLYGHQGIGLSARFSPDGSSIVSSGRDGAVRIRPCDVCVATRQLLAIAALHTTRTLTPSERKQYMHE